MLENTEPILVRETQDAYALGVMAYQLVTRNTQPPFRMEVCQHSFCLLLFSSVVQRGSRFGCSTLKNVTL